MFVAGLLPPSTTSRDRASSTASASGLPTSRRASVSSPSNVKATSPTGSIVSGAVTSLLPHLETALPSTATSPTVSPLVKRQPLSREGGVEGGEALSGVEEEQEKTEEFDTLVRDLRVALDGKGGKGKMWVGEEARKDFRIVLVDKVCEGTCLRLWRF